MRCSVDDPDFDWHRYKDIIIYLDNMPQTKVIAFDTDQGWIDRYKTDDLGSIIVIFGQAIDERVYGEVKVEYFTPDKVIT